MGLLGQIVGSAQKTLSRSAVTAGIIARLKHQCDSVIGHRLSAGIDPELNGEKWIAEQVAPRSSYFVDVGANVGHWSKMFAELMPKSSGMLIEASPETVIALKENLQAWGLGHLTVEECAASDEDGMATFHAETDHGETASLLASHSRQTAKPVTVITRRLDMLLAASLPIDMLKIDAEGFDLRVMQGTRNLLAAHTIGVVQFEYNHPWMLTGSTLNDAFTLLGSNDYKVRVLLPGRLGVINPLRTGEYYRYSNFLAYCESAHSSQLDQLPLQNMFV